MNFSHSEIRKIIAPLISAPKLDNKSNSCAKVVLAKIGTYFQHSIINNKLVKEIKMGEGGKSEKLALERGINVRFTTNPRPMLISQPCEVTYP